MHMHMQAAMPNQGHVNSAAGWGLSAEPCGCTQLTGGQALHLSPPEQPPTTTVPYELEARAPRLSNPAVYTQSLASHKASRIRPPWQFMPLVARRFKLPCRPGTEVAIGTRIPITRDTRTSDPGTVSAHPHHRLLLYSWLVIYSTLGQGRGMQPAPAHTYIQSIQ